MRYRVKSYQVSNNTIVLADPALSALTIEDIRLIVNETTTNEDQQVLCSSAQKSAFVSGVTSGAAAAGGNPGATISFKSGVTIAGTDKLTIELDLGDSPSASNAAILEQISSARTDITSAYTGITNAIATTETNVKNEIASAESHITSAITSAQTGITSELSSAESRITSAVTSAETQIKSAVTSAQTSIETIDNIIREAVMGNVPEFNAASAYSINTLVKYTDTSVNPSVTKVYRIDVAHTAGVTWANTEKSEVSVLSVINEFATGYFVELNDDGVDTYTLNLDKSAVIIENTLNID